MPPFGPISRRDLIRALRDAGFTGPYPRRRHEAMLRQLTSIVIPNPHRGDVSRNLLAPAPSSRDQSRGAGAALDEAYAVRGSGRVQTQCTLGNALALGEIAPQD